VRLLRSFRTRLTLLLFATALAAVAFISAYVTPQLESSLRAEKLRSLEASAYAYAGQLRPALAEEEVNERVRQISDRASTRVTLFGVNGVPDPDVLFLTSDSNADASSIDPSFYVLAEDSLRTGELRSGFGSSDEGAVAQVARPLSVGGNVNKVVVFSSTLADVTDNVAVIRGQILVAGGLALLLAAVAGWLVSRTIAQRVKTLEEGARRVARGDFTAHFPSSHGDELGQLARALEDMQRQLAQLDSARKRFIATASHELRTPLFSLAGFLELLEDEDLDEETRRAFIRHVREQATRLQKLAADLLDLSRLEAGSLELRPESTDVGTLARTVAAEFAPALAAHASHLELRLAAERIEAVCDPERVAQVLRILIDNALTHTPAGTDVVVAAARENGTLHLVVADAGPGIQGDAVQRVFEPFFTSDDAQGSGLGLAIARELAERMHGRLDVDSAPGRTTFELAVPA
jgi:signal transduction histidine kinase